MKDIKIDKKDLKNPDAFQAELQKGFQWTTQHSKMVATALLGLLVLGAGVSAKSYLDEKSENEIQAQYFQVEKKWNEKKSSFETAESQATAAAKKDSKAKASEAPPAHKASGDFEQDYGTLAAEMMKIIDSSPKSKAAKMAALNVAEIQLQYGKFQEAQELLKKVESNPKDLLSGLVLLQLGTAQADLNDCNSAISTWQKVVTSKEIQSLHPAAKLKQGLCYENTKDVAKAEQMYTEARNEDKDSAAGRSADKYLKLLQATK